MQASAARCIRAICVGLVAGLLVAAAHAADDEGDEDDFFHYGVIEYELSCLPCHGIDGRGDGPEAGSLEIRPADLTQITKANGGTFPAERLAIIIDGRALVAAHGPREMPIWGERYRVPVPDAEVEWDVEHEAQARIDALVSYIEVLQELTRADASYSRSARPPDHIGLLP